MSEESSITLNVDDLSQTTPVLPLRDVVVYPHMVIPLFVGRERSISALDQAMQAGKQILLVAQKEADVDEPGADDIYRLGTLATILQLLKLPATKARQRPETQNLLTNHESVHTDIRRH